ncbi:MAG: minichromosome maintenance protein MCM [Candidatus Nanohaloarchaeota archaeon QJJ-7]|nr:minichromosome maintenance protein MCM [Candidatus Nanohaloarchaeota archaeon QJJ-7]
MSYTDMVDRFEEFLREVYEDDLGKAESEGDEAVVVDFEDLEKFDHEFADEITEKPEDALEAADEAVSLLSVVDKDLKIRFENLPKRTEVKIRDLRSNHIGKMVAVKGIVKRASEVRPEVVSADFECTSCGDVYTKEQDSSKLKSPYKCDCGNRKFEVVEKDMVDIQGVSVEENPRDIEGSEQPRDISVYLKEDLVDPEFQKNVTPGNQVIVNGILREAPQDNDSKRYDLFMEGNYVDPKETEFQDIQIEEEEEEEILELAKGDKVFQRIVNSIAPSIYGHEKIKEAIALQLFSGVRKERPDGTVTRGDMHILLIGEPGTGKSQLLQYVGELAPKGKYVVGKSATGAGITATVVRDEITDSWSLEAGALVLANKGMATIDEIDKMSNEDRSSLHEAMEQQTISVSKANIQATLQAQTAILAAGNPKFGRFDPYEPIPEQINIGDTLLSRFDLIFPVKDRPDEEKDKKLAEHVMNMHTEPGEYKGDIETDLLRKYIAYGKQNVKPEVTDEAKERLKDFYVRIRGQGSDREGERSVPMTARQLEALIRLSEASARVRLSEKVEEEDAQRAIDLLTHSLKQIGTDPETGEFDIDRVETGMASSERDRIMTIRRIISSMQDDDEPVPVEDVLAEAEEQGIDESEAQEALNRLEQQGEVYRPQQGGVSTL